MSPNAQASISQAGGSPSPSSGEGDLAQATVERLLAVNRDFYASVNLPFDATRSHVAQGMREAVARLYPNAERAAQTARESAAAMAADVPVAATRLRVLDAGCGNGRFAWALAERDIAFSYLGIDDDEGLLARARLQINAAPGAQAEFLRINLASDDLALLGKFDLVALLAVLHHFPGKALREALLRKLANALAPGGRLLLSTWQFLDDPRLSARLQPWEAVGLTAQDVAPGDALLPWDQGTHALRYAHHLDAAEVATLAARAGLQVVDAFHADGKSGRLNYYAILARQDDAAA